MWHDVGDVARLWSVWRNAAGDQTAPTTLALRIRHPDGTVESVAPTPAEAGDETAAEAALDQTLSGVTGVYRVDVAFDASGLWLYTWDATGTVAEAETGAVIVRRDRVGAVTP